MGESHSKVQKTKAPATNPADKEETKVNTEAQHKSPTKNQNDFQISSADFIKTKTTKFQDEYVLGQVLGMGAFGEVRKVTHKATNLTRAAKLLKKAEIDSAERSKLLSEVKILSSLDHPHIMRIFEMFEDNSRYYIVSEFLEGGELFDRIIEAGNFSEKDAANIMQQILSAVAYCHKHGIVHRDLKPENLVYESKKKDANLKVIDFGGAKAFEVNQKMKETQGTAYYIAPEVLTGSYNEKCDIWSCGVIMYILLSGMPPFPGRDDRDILKKVQTGKYNFNDPIWGSVSDGAKNFIKRMMEMDVKKRLTAQEALDDPWFQQVLTKQEINLPLATQSLENLKRFGFESKLQEAAWVFLVSYFATKEEKEKLLETFKAIDIDHDGQLTKEELTQGYIKIMGMSTELAEIEAENVMKTIDTNKSGSIDYTEFVNATISRANLLKKDKLETVFKVFDRNGDGRISAEELRFLFNEGKTYGISEDVWTEWIAQVDQNSDGGISLDEFRDMMVSLMNRY